MTSTPGSDRRRRRRYPLGLSVRLQIDGAASATTAELRDVSATGCFLRLPDEAPLNAERRVAIGIVLPGHQVGLCRGRVVRRTPGEGVGILIDQANPAFDQFVGELARQDVAAIVAA